MFQGPNPPDGQCVDSFDFTSYISAFMSDDPRKHPGYSVFTQLCIDNPNFKFTVLMEMLDLYSVGRCNFETRLAQLMTTYYLAGTAGISITAKDFAGNGTIEYATNTKPVIKYICTIPWLVVLILSSLIMVTLGLIELLLEF